MLQMAWAIPFLYYTYMGVLGFSKMWLDIATFFVAVLTGFAVEYHVLRRAGHESFVLGTWIMAIVEGVPVSEMLNHSFYEVFENGDKKWLVTYADVALNGNKHILHDYSPEIDKTLTIYCFQPAPGYCACVLIPS